MQEMFRGPEDFHSPVEFSTPQELSIENIQKIDEDLNGIVIVSKFAAIMYTGASAIEVGPIRHILVGMTHVFEPTYFFRYRVLDSRTDALKARDVLLSEITVRALGE